MKTNSFIKKTTLPMVGVFFLVICQYSCTDYWDDLFEKRTKNAKVGTLVPDFQANDGLSVDRFGNVYASNFGSFTGTEVLKVHPKTAEVTIAVDSLRAPTGNVVDRSGNIFVVHNVRRLSADTNQIQGDVLKVSADGTRTVIATLPGFPAGIALDNANNVYVSNFSFPGVHKITPDGEVSLFVRDNRLAGGVGIDFDRDGNLFVGNFNTGQVLRIAPDATIEVLATIPTVVENFVIGYITYFAGYIFATAPGEHVIYRVSMSGEATVFAGNGVQESVDGPLLEAGFDTPNGITADRHKKVLYITEGGAGALRTIALK